eukprot:gene3989-731_t
MSDDLDLDKQDSADCDDIMAELGIGGEGYDQDDTSTDSSDDDMSESNPAIKGLVEEMLRKEREQGQGGAPNTYNVPLDATSSGFALATMDSAALLKSADALMESVDRQLDISTASTGDQAPRSVSPAGSAVAAIISAATPARTKPPAEADTTAENASDPGCGDGVLDIDDIAEVEAEIAAVEAQLALDLNLSQDGSGAGAAGAKPAAVPRMDDDDDLGQTDTSSGSSVATDDILGSVDVSAPGSPAMSPADSAADSGDGEAAGPAPPLDLDAPVAVATPPSPPKKAAPVAKAPAKAPAKPAKAKPVAEVGTAAQKPKAERAEAQKAKATPTKATPTKTSAAKAPVQPGRAKQPQRPAQSRPAVTNARALQEPGQAREPARARSQGRGGEGPSHHPATPRGQAPSRKPSSSIRKSTNTPDHSPARQPCNTSGPPPTSQAQAPSPYKSFPGFASVPGASSSSSRPTPPHRGRPSTASAQGCSPELDSDTTARSPSLSNAPAPAPASLSTGHHRQQPPLVRPTRSRSQDRTASPKRPSGTPHKKKLPAAELAAFLDRTKRHHEEVQHKKAEAKARLEEAELEKENQHTFRPAINRSSDSSRTDVVSRVQLELEEKQRRIDSKKQVQKDRELEECTFKPVINSASSKYTKLHIEDRAPKSSKSLSTEDRVYLDNCTFRPEDIYLHSLSQTFHQVHCVPARIKNASKHAGEQSDTRPCEEARLTRKPALPREAGSPSAAEASPLSPEPEPAPQCENCEKHAAELVCVGCGGIVLCGACSITVHALPMIKKQHHTPQPLEQAQVASFARCEVHQGALKRFYCDSCDVLVCSDCIAIGLHKDHTFLSVHDAAKALRTNIAQVCDNMHQGLSSSTEVYSSILSQLKQLKTERETCRRAIEQEFEDAMKAAAARKAHLLNEIDTQQRAQQEPLQAQAINMKRLLAQAQKEVEVLDRCRLSAPKDTTDHTYEVSPNLRLQEDYALLASNAGALQTINTLHGNDFALPRTPHLNLSLGCPPGKTSAVYCCHTRIHASTLLSTGTQGGRHPYSNPITAHLLGVSASHGFQKGCADDLACRQTHEHFTLSNDASHSFLEFQLPSGHQLQLTNYTLRHGNSSDDYALCDWVMLGSNEKGEDWKVLHEVRSDAEHHLGGNHRSYTWEVKHRRWTFNRFRLRLTAACDYQQARELHQICVDGVECYRSLLAE